MIHVRDIRARVSPGFRLQIPELRLRPGITVLVGPNGAGKTTLLRLLATVTSASSGEIIYGGCRVRDQLPLIRSNIGYMPAGLSLYENMTVMAQMKHFASLKGLSGDEESRDILEQLGLYELANTKIRRLSHGQQQRIGIAQAMLGEPMFLFLDEPLNYLDAIEQKRVQFAMLRRAKRGVILVSTHELNEWGSYADRVVWLEEGQLAEDLPLSAWKEQLPAEPRVYEGRMPVEIWRGLDPQRVLRARQEEGTAYVRILGDPPTVWFKEVEPTMEEAYLIRRFRRTGLWTRFQRE